MNKKLIILLILSLNITLSANADYIISDSVTDFTGESFFAPATMQQTKEVKTEKKSNETIPPIKKLRLTIQNKLDERAQKKTEFAPTKKEAVHEGEIETSEYASKDIEDNFDNYSPDGFDADEETIKENKNRKFWRNKKDKISETQNTEDIILDCDNVSYDTPNYLINATGNVNVVFVKQGTTVKADTMTFDRMNNTIKAEGNVKIIKNGRVVTGEYIFVDMNEENALIENPITEDKNIIIKSKKGYVYGDKIVQENGTIIIDESYPINFNSGKRGPHVLTNMLTPKDQTLSSDMEKGIINFTAKDIKITQKGDLETIAITKGRLNKDNKTIFKIPAVKVYTNKNHDYAETNIWEIGSYRGLGLYTGPGVVFELPKGSVLKAMPILNYKSGIGIGALGRFSSGTNNTIAGYGTAASKIIVYGKQELDDNLFLQYGVNGYMDEWFLGRRRPKYGASLVYNNGYSAKDFILKNRLSSFTHRLEAGYFQDLDFDRSFEKINGGTEMGTTRFRYMAEARQNFYNYVNEDKQTAFAINLSSQLSAALYGTGDTQIIGRLGPTMHLQYKRWMQDIGYYFSAYNDETPMPIFDAYRYGKQNLYLREYFRLCKWLTVSWFTSINMTNDSPNNRTFQENAFFFSFGPDDLKMNLGYDWIRERLYCTLELKMDAKGTTVEYDSLEIKQDKKENKKPTPQPKKESEFAAPVQPKVLQHAVVEDVKVMDDVL